MKWLAVLPFLLIPACSDAPPSPKLVGLQLSVEDVSCTEAWLRIRSSNSKGTISLVRDGNALMAFSASVADTVVMDEGLGPGRSYTYQASRMGGGMGSGLDVTEPVLVRTLDTTSHDFSWRITQLGDGASSFLHDVAIINDTLAYAVGGVHIRDSLGHYDPQPYNLARWDGNSWEHQRASVFYRGSFITPPLYAVFAFSSSDIWLSAGVPIHGDGARWQQFHLFDMGVLTQNDGSLMRIWGASSGSVSFAGNRGTIARYDNETWQRLESGTAIDLRDITGDISGKPVWVCGYSNDRSQSVLLASDGHSWHTVWTRGGGATLPYGDLVSSVAVVGRSLYVTSNVGVFRRSITETSADAQRLLSLGSFAYRIRGSSANNIFVVGDYTRIWHYNGLTWKLLNDGVPARPLYGLAVSENLVVAVGADYSTIPARAVIYMGRR